MQGMETHPTTATEFEILPLDPGYFGVRTLDGVKLGSVVIDTRNGTFVASETFGRIDNAVFDSLAAAGQYLSDNRID